MPFRKTMDTQIAINAMLKGEFVLVFDLYSTGLIVLKALKNYLEKQHKQHTFNEQRDYRSEYNTLSNRLLVSVSNNKLKVKKSPEIGWLKVLYPDLTEYLLPFPKVQGLNSAWQWYKTGINIPGLDKKIKPFYDTYFPTRFEHLDLFNNWLSNTRTSKDIAYDIGVGSGVLTFQLLQHGFKTIIATDTNPNAIIGMEESLSKTKLNDSSVDLRYGNLFTDCNSLADLIVFNPPWVPINQDIKGIDKAIYYDEHLFPEFFKAAEKHLKPNGRLVLIFSNLAEVTNVTTENPIELELLTNSRFEKDELLTKPVSKASNKTKRNQNWRKDELVQLWVLKLK
jgi:tRNA1(Val) A37 N6-methylase TrmN6